jgi:hypothetical protein
LQDPLSLDQTAGRIPDLGLARIDDQGVERLAAQQVEGPVQALDPDHVAVGLVAVEQRQGVPSGPLQDQDTWTLGHGSSIPPGGWVPTRNATNYRFPAQDLQARAEIVGPPFLPDLRPGPPYNSKVFREARMRSRVPSAIGTALCLAILLPAARAAEEAVLPDGRRLPGTLTFAGGRLHFRPTSGQAPLSLAELHAVRFPATPVPPLGVGRALRVVLADGQCLTGQLLDLDEQGGRLRTAWAEALAVPRQAVAAVTQLPGWNTFFAEDFSPGLPGWKVSGALTSSAALSPAGQHVLALSRAGQSVTHDLDPPVATGGFVVDFRLAGVPGGARWLAEAEFPRPGGPRTVRVVVAGSSNAYEAEVPGVEGTTCRLPRIPGWHRLRLDFAPDALSITIDDTALWYAEGHGPGGPLRQIRLSCTAAAGAALRGEVAFADVSLARALPGRKHPPGDPEQDEVWLASGDQLFGQVRHVDGRSVEVVGRFGRRMVPWGEVRGIYLRHPAPDRRPAGEERVRVRLDPGAGEQLDELRGTVRGLDANCLTLDDPLLGECKVPRGRLRRLQIDSPGAKEGELP